MESDYDEDLSDNVFFRVLQSENSELFERATAEGWIICVPRAGALPKYALTQDDFFSHVLIPSDELPETHFRTLNDKEIRISNRLVTVEQNNSVSPFSTHILFEETFYTEDLLKYKVLCIENPLEQYSDGCINENCITTVQTLRDCIDLLWTESKGKEVLEKMDEAISNFLSKNNRLEFKPLQIQKDLVGNLYIQCLQIALCDTRLREKTNANRFLLSNIKVSVESYIHHGIYKKLIKGVTACTAYEDSCFNKIVRNLTDIQLSDLDIRTELTDTVPKARTELSRVDCYSTVLGKIGCLKKTVAAVSKLESSNFSHGNIIAADDLLPMLIFLIIKSGLPNWIAHLTYMKQFNFSSSNDYSASQNNFLVTSLEAAIEHIKSGLMLGSSAPEAQFDYEIKNDNSPSFEMVEMSCKDRTKHTHKISTPLSDLFEMAQIGNVVEMSKILSTNAHSLNDSSDLNKLLCHPLCSCDKCERQLSVNLCNTTPTVHSCDDKGLTVLHIACTYGRPKVVDLLLSSGADTEACDYSGLTPLHYASVRGHQNALLLLLHGGATLDSVDNEGNTALHFAASNGHEACIKAMLYFSEQHSNIKFDINKQNNVGDTALHCAARWGYEIIVNLLLDYGANPEIKNKRKSTPLDIAHNLHISRLLSEGSRYHCSLILVTPEFKKVGKQDIKVAAASKVQLDFTEDEATKLQCNGQSRLEFGDRPHTTEQMKKVDRLLRAIAHGDTQLACFYLKMDMNIDSLLQKDKCHPLCKCTLHNMDGNYFGKQSSTLNRLNVNSCNADGYTALHVASAHGRVDITKILLTAGALTNVVTRKSQTPLHLVCENGRIIIAELLLQNGSEINCQDYLGNSPLHYACYKASNKLVELLMQYKPNLNLCNNNGKTPKEVAEEKLSLSIINRLTNKS